jgi:hypothetical protein
MVKMQCKILQSSNAISLRLFLEERMEDPASRHTAKMNMNFLNKHKLNYITPAKSPDAAHMDFGIWGILKRRLLKQDFYTIWALKDEMSKLLSQKGVE